MTISPSVSRSAASPPAATRARSASVNCITNPPKRRRRRSRRHRRRRSRHRPSRRRHPTSRHPNHRRNRRRRPDRPISLRDRPQDDRQGCRHRRDSAGRGRACAEDRGQDDEPSTTTPEDQPDRHAAAAASGAALVRAVELLDRRVGRACASSGEARNCLSIASTPAIIAAVMSPALEAAASSVC